MTARLLDPAAGSETGSITVAAQNRVRRMDPEAIRGCLPLQRCGQEEEVTLDGQETGRTNWGEGLAVEALQNKASNAVKS